MGTTFIQQKRKSHLCIRKHNDRKAEEKNETMTIDVIKSKHRSYTLES